MKTPGKTVVKAEEFWSTKEKVAKSYESGKDAVARFLAALNAPEEAIVES